MLPPGHFILALLLTLHVAAFAGNAQKSGKDLGPTYTLQARIIVSPDNRADRAASDFSQRLVFSNVSAFEWESYDGWYNNLAHPEWGGAGEYWHIKFKRVQDLLPFFVRTYRYAFREENACGLS